MKLQKGHHGTKNYVIEVEGRLGENWTDYFEGLTVTYARGITTITGPVKDQAALHGLLNRIRDLNLNLISAHRLDSSELER
jgi:hypothetical protein